MIRICVENASEPDYSNVLGSPLLLHGAEGPDICTTVTGSSCIEVKSVVIDLLTTSAPPSRSTLVYPTERLGGATGTATRRG